MEQRPFHYDGSVQTQFESTDDIDTNNAFEVTDSIRMNISANPYFMNQWE